MPDECDATMGATAKGASGVADPQDVGLQRALEVELVNHLRTQNSQLMEELDRMRALLTQAGTGSNSSWSDVGGASACAGIPPDVMSDGGQRRGGYQTPKSSQKAEMGKRDARFTPNGTRIPDGTPPEADGSEPRHVPQPPPEKPNVPPFPKSFMSDGTMEKFLDSYDRMESVPKVLKVQHAWEPTTEMSPRAARAFWLEQEVASLKGSMARLTEGNGFKNSEYWSKGFHPPTGPPVVLGSQQAVASAGIDVQRLQDRAGSSGMVYGGSGETALHDRACTLSNGPKDCQGQLLGGCGDPRLQGRASALSTGHTECQGHLLGGSGAEHHQARACTFGTDSHKERPGGDLHPRARALHGVGTELLDCGAGGFKDLPGHGLGGGGVGAGTDRTYGPWTEGSSVAKLELPDLPEASSPLQFGDWLHLSTPVMKDLSQVADWWWESTLRESKCYYDQWKSSTPLQRIQIRPRLPDDLCERRFQRTEQRGVQMLLKAIPAAEQQELVTDRALSSTAILYKLMVRFQPGGAGEKQILLKQLTSMPTVSTIQEVAAAIRNWRRHFGRAEEVQAVLPDGIMLLKALDEPLQRIAALDQQAAFRLSQSRMQLQLDERPDHRSLWSFSQCLLAEAETVAFADYTNDGIPTNSFEAEAVARRCKILSNYDPTW